MSRLFEASQRALRGEDPLAPDASAKPAGNATEQFPTERRAVSSVTTAVPSRSTATNPSTRESQLGSLRAVAAPTSVASVASNEKLLPAAPAAAQLEYRRLAAALLELQLDHNIKTVMVTSAMPGEGKTLVSANLALTLSRVYRRRVLLVDADMRRPAVHALFGVANRDGFSEALQNGTFAQSALQHLEGGIAVATAGRSIADPVAYLSGPGLGQLLPDLTAQYDWVIFDTPPAELLPDASLLGRHIDAFVFVVKAGRTPYPRISRALEALGREKIAGVVLNQIEADATRAAEYGASYYSDTEPGR